MKRRTKNTILAVAVSVIAIFLPAFLLGKWVEGIIFFICHWLIREQFPKQYHHILPAMCRLITSVVFFFGVSFVLPFALSLLSAIPINYFIGWVGFVKKEADTYELKYNRLKWELEKGKQFNVDTCSRDELIARCRQLGMSEQNTEIAIEFFIKKVPRKALAEKYFIEPESVKSKKKRMKEKLNSK